MMSVIMNRLLELGLGDTIHMDFDSYDSFKRVWFVQSGQRSFDVIDKLTTNKIGTVTDNKVELSDNSMTSEDVLREYAKFLKRPEAQITRSADKVMKSFMLSSYSDVYNIKLIGCILINALKTSNNMIQGPDNSTEVADRIAACVTWLRSTDFYDAPASTVYHDSTVGGLVKHSLNVVDKISELVWIDSFRDVDIADAILVGLVHDWCKIGYYQSYERNVKQPDGSWVKQPSFKVADTPLLCYGHGVSSMAAAMRFFSLTGEQQLAIRWHMGEYNVAPNEMNELHQANAHVPMCYLIQFADRLACTEY